MKITNGYRIKNVDIMKLTLLISKKFTELKKQMLFSYLKNELEDEIQNIETKRNFNIEDEIKNMIEFKKNFYLNNKNDIENMMFLEFSLVVFIKDEYIYILVYSENKIFLKEFKKLTYAEEFFYYDDENHSYKNNLEIWEELLSNGPNDFPCNNGLIIEPSINYFQLIDAFFMDYLKNLKIGRKYDN